VTVYGYNQAELCWGSSWIADADVEKVIAGIAELGGSWVRMAVQVGTLDNLDNAVTQSVAAGLKPLLVVIGNPSLPGGYDGTVASLANQCKFLAQRYGPSGTGALQNTVSAFEIYNESNRSDNPPRVADGAAFAPFLKAAYTAIKSVHTSSTVIAGGTIPIFTDPNAWAPSPLPPFIIFGSTSDPVKWYTDLYAAGCQNFMDAVGFHLYFDEGVTPTTTERQWTYLPGVRAVMNANGDTGKQIWITETGEDAPLNADAATLAQTRDRLKAIIDLLTANTAALNLGTWFIYNYRCYVGGDGVGGTFGMVNPDFTHRTPIWEYAKTISGAGTVDTTPPSAPTGLMVTDVTATSAALTWNPATDNVAVIGYRVYLGGSKVADATSTSATLTGLTPGTAYSATVTAMDAAGNESAASSAKTFTTSPPSGLQARFSYLFTGSTLPTVFDLLGLGFAVSSGIALPVAPTTDGMYNTVAPYNSNQQSPDHSSRITLAAVPAGPDRGGMAIARMKPDGTEWVAALHTGGGPADSLKIVTCMGGVVRIRNAADVTPAAAAVEIDVKGNVYTASLYDAHNNVLATVGWADINSVYTGSKNLRTGLGWLHKRVESVNYPPPGITQWNAADLSPVSPSGPHGFAGGFDLWMLAVTDSEDDWGLVISTGQWEVAL